MRIYQAWESEEHEAASQSGHWDPSLRENLEVSEDHIPLEELFPPDFLDASEPETDMIDIDDSAFDDPMLSALVSLGVREGRSPRRSRSYAQAQA